MSDIEYKEQWVIRVDNKEFVTNRDGKDRVIAAMQKDKRFVALSDKDFVSVRHISYIYLHNKQIQNQLSEPVEKKEFSDEDIEKARIKIQEIRDRFPTFIKKKHE